MMEVHTCSICGWAYVGHGNNAQPCNRGDFTHWALIARMPSTHDLGKKHGGSRPHCVISTRTEDSSYVPTTYRHRRSRRSARGFTCSGEGREVYSRFLDNLDARL